MENEEEEEVVAEVEAVEAVYGTDCVLLRSFPPHFHISLKPRTADVSSQQFVEAVLEIRASPQYPKEPPSVDLVDCKGLDEQRQKHLLNYIQNKAYELSPCLMLVAVCEEAVEKLSAMNHPDGDCPLCLFPLVPEDQQSETLPFMKLMSCFHCFHSECIIRWWKWLQDSKVDSANTDSAAAHRNQDNHEKMEESIGNCPVCRKPFLAKDLDHVLALVGSYSSQLSLDNDEVNDEEKLLRSEDEIIRRQKFEAILNLQKENSGLIEPKRDIVILPGMYLPQPVAMPSSTSTKESDEQQQKDPPAAVSGKHANGMSNGSSSSRQRNFGARRQKPRSDHHHSSSTVRNPRKPVQQWVRRDNPSNKQ
ncbi:E3 ubiquitin-protein ligase RNF25 [Spatholobus suberectus]|nr:E3 ubiquitin-protein ligase RNF25 [Spatholobus suberectus]